jgi:hypothetical protein
MVVMGRFRTLQETCVKKKVQVDDGSCHVGRRRNAEKFNRQAQIQMKVNTAVGLFN